MRTSRLMSHILIAGTGLGAASAAHADVMLLSQSRSVTASSISTRTYASPSFADWSSNSLFSQSGANGYWNGATQYSSFLPDGSTGTGQSMFAQGSAKSVAYGTFKPGTTWTASSSFQSDFRVASGNSQIADITMSIQATGAGSSVLASLMKGATTVWTYSGNGDDLRSLTLDAGDYTFKVIANSSLTTAGVGSDAQYNFGVGFTNIPGPSAMAMIALSAFLRRRRS
jgi:hypothetical protein